MARVICVASSFCHAARRSNTLYPGVPPGGIREVSAASRLESSSAFCAARTSPSTWKWHASQVQRAHHVTACDQLGIC